ncbi:MAG TPA: WD40 repeat domain-containing protein [Bryobacteraceae bacterium]|nr:WD40 repeat domain-containing protein [Bryobacteraceae bacterium]
MFEAATARPIWNLVGHSEPVIRIDFSPKGELICHCPGCSYSVDTSSALASQNPAVCQIWETATGKFLGEFSSPQEKLLRSLDASPDGRLLLTGKENGLAEVWNWQTGQRVSLCAGHAGPVKGVALSLDGRYAATAGADKTIGIWDAQTGARLFTGSAHIDEVNCVAFSPDGALVASGSNDCTVKVWDAHSGRLLQERVNPGLTSAVERVAFDAAGQVTAYTAGELGGIFASTTITASGVKGVRGGDHVEPGVIFSPDRRICATEGRRFKPWESRSAWQAPPQVSRVAGIANVTASAAGDAVVIYDGGIVVLDARTGREITKFSCPTGSHAIALSYDNRLVASAGSDSVIRIWETATGRQIQNLQTKVHFTSLTLSSDGQFLAAGGHQGGVSVWDTNSGSAVAQVGQELRHVSSVAFYPGGKHVAAGSNAVYLWEIGTGRLVAQCNVPEDPMAAAFLPMALFVGVLDMAQVVPMAPAKATAAAGGQP